MEYNLQKYICDTLNDYNLEPKGNCLQASYEIAIKIETETIKNKKPNRVLTVLAKVAEIILPVMISKKRKL